MPLLIISSGLRLELATRQSAHEVAARRVGPFFPPFQAKGNQRRLSRIFGPARILAYPMAEDSEAMAEG